MGAGLKEESVLRGFEEFSRGNMKFLIDGTSNDSENQMRKLILL